MTPEEHRLIVELQEQVAENTRILQSLQRASRLSLAMKTIYWVLIIGLSVGAFYFIQPYADLLKDGLSGGGDVGSLFR